MFLTYFLICPDRDILFPRDRQAAQQSLSLISNKFLEIILFIPASALHNIRIFRHIFTKHIFDEEKLKKNIHTLCFFLSFSFIIQ